MTKVDLSIIRRQSVGVIENDGDVDADDDPTQHDAPDAETERKVRAASCLT